MKKLGLILFSFIILFFSNNKSFSKEGEIIGLAKVIDGDTIKIGAKKIRLFGIDAPEKNQICKKKFLSFSFVNFQKNYNCGQISTNNLKKKIGKEKIKCLYKSRDRYKRYLGTCYIKKVDLNKWMVENGYALAYINIPENMNCKKNLQEKIKWVSGKVLLRPEEWRRIMVKF